MTETNIETAPATETLEHPPCCALTYERAYRHGYRDGSVQAAWDIGRRLSVAGWNRFLDFYRDHLGPWVTRGDHMDTATVVHEEPPRFDLDLRR